MPTRVLDLDLAQLPETITNLGDYDAALVLCRWQGVPVGQVRLVVDNGRISLTELQHAIVHPHNLSLWQQLTRRLADRWLVEHLGIRQVPVQPWHN